MDHTAAGVAYEQGDACAGKNEAILRLHPLEALLAKASYQDQRRSQESHHARKSDRPDSQPASLNDLAIQRESDRRFRGKRPSKLFHDLLRWEQHKINEAMILLRAQQSQIRSYGKFEPFTKETVCKETVQLYETVEIKGEKVTEVQPGEVLRDPRLRPFYIHPLLDPSRILQMESEIEFGQTE